MSQQSSLQDRYLDAWITLALVILAGVLFLPYIGSYALWDPWEAHYSQVAMEMVQKGSWWEPWYRNSNRSFWSKPIFTFWLMISSLKTFRIAQVGDFANAEFYLRMPIALFGAIGIGYIYFFVSRLWNRTMGVLASLVLMTSPQYFLISRQVMVDIPFVVIQSIAIGFLALGMFDKAPVDSDEEKQFGVKTSLYLAAGFAAAQFIEVIYWQVQLKQTFSVSFQQSSLHWFAIAAFFLVWAVVRQYVTTPQTRFFYLFFFWSGLSFLAKGLLSIVLPGGIALFYILLTGDWDLLRRMRLVYISDKIKTRTSVIIGTISSLLAVWLISYPMFKGRGLTGVFKDLLAFRIKTDSSQMYPFAWLKVSL